MSLRDELLAEAKKATAETERSLIEHPPWIVIFSALVAAVFLIWRHRANIQRIRAGTENMFRFGSPR